MKPAALGLPRQSEAGALGEPRPLRQQARRATKQRDAEGLPERAPVGSPHQPLLAADVFDAQIWGAASNARKPFRAGRGQLIKG
jgi:hypothetical protein